MNARIVDWLVGSCSLTNYGEKGIAMKKYVKPSLKELGQLRMVTKLTTPAG